MAIGDLYPNPAEEGDVGRDSTTRPAVLVVDDDAAIRGLLQAILGQDYEVKTAKNGRDALEVVEREELDVIVMDLSMPVLDGPGLFRELRARGDTTPVLVASSHGARAAQRELGAEGAIEKPFHPDALLQAVGSLIH